MANRLETFEVSVVGPNPSYGSLYANGRQQCRLAVKVLKINDSNTMVPLSPSEIDSVTILPRSNELFPAMAKGWFCDKTKNSYDEGSPPNARMDADATLDIDVSAAQDLPEDAKSSNRPTIIDRYMRFDNSVASASTKFMACMTLDAGTANAKTVSTYINTSDHQFDFFVTLNPLVPYRLRTSQLKAERDDALSIEYSKDQYLDVDVYYWMLPNNIRILSESFANAGFSGKQLRFAYARNEGTLYAGMAIISTATSLTLGDIGILPSSDKVKPSTQVRLLNSGERSLRAARYFCNSVSISPAYNKELYWTIIDNFGCESRFIIRGNDSDKGNTLLINDA